MPVYQSYKETPVNDWEILKIEKSILDVFDTPTTMVYSCTWLNLNDIPKSVEWVEQSDKHSAVFVGLFDPSNIKEHIPDHTRIHFVTTEDVVFWLIVTGKKFKEYSKQDVFPDRFKYDFLCYQRKVFLERVTLYNALHPRNGIITLSGEDNPPVNNNVPDYKEMHEVIPDDYIPMDTMMPYDLLSLGDIDIWRQSFLIVVSETVQHNNHNIFLSEKTFKPIIGMRPFIHFGMPRMTELLESRGFKTFNEDFGFVPSENLTLQARQITKIVDGIKDPNNLYEKLYPKILHNRNLFQTAADDELKKVHNIAESIQSLYK